MLLMYVNNLEGFYFRDAMNKVLSKGGPYRIKFTNSQRETAEVTINEADLTSNREFDMGKSL